MLRFQIKHFLAHMITTLSFKKEGSSILMFHSISSGKDDIFKMDLGNFEQVIKEVLKTGVTHLKEVNPQERSVVITFDDGYKDNFTLAYPILKKYNCPFTIFVATDFIGQEDYLNEDDIRTLAADELVTIGGHGKSHNPLLGMTKKEAFEELSYSKNRLEKIIGKDVDTMSFPHGSYDKELVDYAKCIGFKSISTSDYGLLENQKETLNRIAVYNCDNKRTISNKVNGKWEVLKKWL